MKSTNLSDLITEVAKLKAGFFNRKAKLEVRNTLLVALDELKQDNGLFSYIVFSRQYFKINQCIRKAITLKLLQEDSVLHTALVNELDEMMKCHIDKAIAQANVITLSKEEIEEAMEVAYGD